LSGFEQAGIILDESDSQHQSLLDLTACRTAHKKGKPNSGVLYPEGIGAKPDQLE
jgi:hypothetical protein